MSRLSQLSAALARPVKRVQLRGTDIKLSSGVSDDAPYFDADNQGQVRAQRPVYCVAAEWTGDLE